MRRLLTISAVALTLGLTLASTASAQQGFSIYLGAFTPQGIDSRGSDDVLYQNSTFLSTLNSPRGIDMNEFNGFTFGGEYLIGFGPHFEAGLGVGFYQKTTPVVYTDLVNATGQEIFQDIKLRVYPFSATVKFLPLSSRNPFQPYIGAGLGVFRWHYSETGQFIDANNNIFVDSFEASGGAVGPLIFGGVRFGVGPFGVGGEVRYQDAKADLPADQGFAGPRLDLSGFNYVATLNFRF
jgi:hypothetical protein